MDDDILKVLVSQEEIKQINHRLGQQIKEDYAGKVPIMIGILKGASVFLSDLIREIDGYLEIDFMQTSSYGDGFESSGEVKVTKDLDADVTGRDIIIVEDIIDSGHTLKKLIEVLEAKNANSVKICTLLDKEERREVDIDVDYIGTRVENEFLVGYGLEYLGKYRNLPYVGVLKPEIYQN